MSARRSVLLAVHPSDLVTADAVVLLDVVECHGAVEALPSGRPGDVVRGVVDGLRHGQVHATLCLGQLAQQVPVHDGEVVDADVGEVLEGLDGRRRAGRGEHVAQPGSTEPGALPPWRRAAARSPRRPAGHRRCAPASACPVRLAPGAHAGACEEPPTRDRRRTPVGAQQQDVHRPGGLAPLRSCRTVLETGERARDPVQPAGQPVLEEQPDADHEQHQRERAGSHPRHRPADGTAAGRGPESRSWASRALVAVPGGEVAAAHRPGASRRAARVTPRKTGSRTSMRGSRPTPSARGRRPRWPRCPRRAVRGRRPGGCP